MLRTRGLASGLCRVFMLTCRPAILILAELFLALGAVRNTTFAADVVAPNGARQPPDSDDGQWLRAAKNFASTRFSALRQIDTRNVKDRKVAWTFSTAETGKELWKTKLGDINTGATMTMAGRQR